jgi:flagellar hook-length control protein FliK
MQQVATSNSDIAALAANTTQSNQQDSSFTEDFGKLLLQHQDARQSSDATKKASGKSNEQAVKVAQDTNDKQQESVTENGKKNSTEVDDFITAKSDNNNIDKSQVVNKDTSEKPQELEADVLTADTAIDEKNMTSDSHSCSVGCHTEESDGDIVIAGDTALEEQLVLEIDELLRQFDLPDLGAETIETASGIPASTETNGLEEGKPLQNEEQDWFALVEKLQTLALSGAESSNTVADESKPLLVEEAANLIEVQGDASQPHLDTESNQSTGAPTLVNAVAEILSKIDLAQVNSNSTEAEIKVEGLLNKLAELQATFETGKAVDTVVQGVAAKVSPLNGDKIIAANNEAQQQLAKSTQTNVLETTGEQLTDKLNQALIATVIAPVSKGEKELQTDPRKQNVTGLVNTEKMTGSTSSPEAVVGDIQANLQGAIPTSELLIDDGAAHPRELVPTALAAKSAPTSSPIEILANMSGDKLDKSLNNLLQRLASEQSFSEGQKAQLTNQQAAAVAVTQLDNPAPAHNNKEFIAALKAGVDEFKAQLAQGREPGIDLKALVADAMSKSTDTSATIGKQPEQMEMAVKAFGQVLDFAQQLNGALEQHQANLLSHNNNMAREVGQNQLEQLKQFQTQTSQFDKAVNISKPEGHQQLAEKVRWMVNAKQLVAEIRLDPAELGSMQVKVSVTGESANISFVVQSQQARDAMESATPRLREMLAEKGIELGQSSVKQDQGQGASEGKEQLAGHNNGRDEHGFDDSNEPSNETFIQQPIVNGALGGIDFFV